MSSNKFKTTYILIAIFIALFLFVYFFEKDKKIDGEDEAETHQILQINPQDLKKIKFNYNDKATVVEKKEEKWKIIKPIKYQARGEKINSVVDEVNTATSEVKFTPEALDDYGLKEPDTKITFIKTNDEKIDLLIGNLNPQQTKVYVKTSLGDEVYLANSSFENRLRLDDEKLKKD